MQRRRILLIVLIAMWLAVPLATSSIDPSSYNTTSIEHKDTLPVIVPVDKAITADSAAYVYTWLPGIGHGDIIDPFYLLTDDISYASFEEVSTGGSFSFQRVFQFNCEAKEYLECSLEVLGYDYSGVTGFWHENLKFSFSDTSVGPWTEVGILDTQTATSYSWSMDVPNDQYFYILVESTGDSNDWGSRNEWKIDYMRVRCTDRRSYNEGVSVNIAHDGDNLYPYRGAGTDDFYEFSCSVSNEEGADLIEGVYLYVYSEDDQLLWGVEWDDNVWDLAVWSHGVNLLELESYITSTSTVLTVVFAVQLTYSCDTVSNIDFRLSHESDTWIAQDRYDRDENARDLDQEPVLQFGVEPSLPERCNPNSSPTMTGRVTFAASVSNQTPHPSHTYVHIVRMEPVPYDWFDGDWIDSAGFFAIDSLTEGGAGTRNQFRVSIYDSETVENEIGPVTFVDTRCDAVEAYEDGATATSVPIGEPVSIFLKLRYEWDHTVITEGSVIWNGVQLTYTPENESWVAHLAPQFEPTIMVFDSLVVNTSDGINTLSSSSTMTLRWTKLGVVLHLDPIVTHTPVSTVYDPHAFIINIWLTDQNQDLFAGWINLTIGGDVFEIYYNGTQSVSFNYYPQVAGGYSLFALYEGDLYHNSSNQTLVGLTAMYRDMEYEHILPTTMIAQDFIQFSFFDVFDNDYQGVFEGVTYIRDYPINVSLSIWWTLSPDFGEPRNFVGTWGINFGAGSASWTLPWDLDNDGRLTDDDFQAYVIIILDGQGVFEDETIHLTIDVKQDLSIEMTIPELTYSDSSRVEVTVQPLHDSSYSGYLEASLDLYMSTDNETWMMIDVISTDSNGWGFVTWLCDYCGPIYFKCEVDSELFSVSTTYGFRTADREGTRLNVHLAGTFTYSDQGVLLIHLSTDDNTPLSEYPIYIEILDDDWVSIGTGLTNDSGYVSILWIPTLPSGSYEIKVRAPMTESEFYDSADDRFSTILVNRETLLITIDEESGNSGHVGALVTDDEGTPVEGVPIRFVLAGDSQPLGTTVTDSEGHAQLEASLVGVRLLRVIFEESEYYEGTFEEMNVTVPLDIPTVTMLVGSVFGSALIIGVVRKKRRGSIEPAPKPVPPDVRKALEEEHELIPERRREETERKIAELDGGIDDASEP